MNIFQKIFGSKTIATMVPTWQEGKPTYPSVSYEKMVREGYTKNELMFSCIEAKIRSRTKDLSGDYILFTSNRDGNQEIYRTKSDGTEAINLTMNPANDQLAKGSPDGSLGAFTSDRTGNMDVFDMRLDGQGLMNLTNSPGSDIGPIWSSDQVWIAFTTDRNGNPEVYIIKPGLSELYNVTNNPYQDKVSDWR